MINNQIEYWKNTIVNMKSDNKIELAKILIEELNSDRLNLSESDDYDRQLSSKLRLILENYTSQEGVTADKKQILAMFDKFVQLSINSRKEVMSQFVQGFLRLVNEEIEKDFIEKCGEKGHEYDLDDWKKSEWTTYEDTIIDHENASFPVNHVLWSRTCPNCGFVEKSFDEPKELVERRKAIEKQKRIQRLRKELRKLEGN